MCVCTNFLIISLTSYFLFFFYAYSIQNINFTSWRHSAKFKYQFKSDLEKNQFVNDDVSTHFSHFLFWLQTSDPVVLTVKCVPELN